MKSPVFKTIMLVTACIGFYCTSLSAQYIYDLPTGPNGGNSYVIRETNKKIECKVNDKKVAFFVINESNQNAKLTAAAASATVLFDYNGEIPAITKQVTITSKNKFEIALPVNQYQLNFVAIQMNYNGELMEARYIINKANSGSTSTN